MVLELVDRCFLDRDAMALGHWEVGCIVGGILVGKVVGVRVGQYLSAVVLGKIAIREGCDLETVCEGSMYDVWQCSEDK